MAVARPAFPFPLFRVLLAPLTALACAAAIPAQAAGSPGPVLLVDGGGARLELSSGARVTVQLPTGAALGTAVSLESGWLAAGTRPVAGAPGDRELLLVIGDAKTSSTLPVPAGKAAALREQPVPLVEDGELAGLVWLEGGSRQSFAVKTAAWNGMSWEAPRTISPPGPGSQLALTAARLRSGDWLLAWSAFDGQDDEIVWSRGSDGVWSRPRRAAADNAVPDITPALTAAGSGALLAWSRYDAGLGEYVVVVSRFTGGHWGAPRTAGPPGSLYPTFEAALDGPLLLYRTAAPRGWEALELDAAGRAVRRAVLPQTAAAESARPVAAANPAGVAFRWPMTGAQRAADWGSGR
jgi:hypothetical protein